MEMAKKKAYFVNVIASAQSCPVGMFYVVHQDPGEAGGQCSKANLLSPFLARSMAHTWNWILAKLSNVLFCGISFDFCSLNNVDPWRSKTYHLYALSLTVLAAKSCQIW